MESSLRTVTSELVAEALDQRGDGQAAAIVAAQARWLRSGAAEDRRAADELVHEITDPKRLDRWRPQISLYGVFAHNLTVLSRKGEDYVWLYDDDIVSLEDGGDYDPEVHATPWDANTDASEAIARHLDAGAADRTKRLHLLVFEGTERIWRTLQLRGATHLVTHLELRPQRARDEGPLAKRFPALRGLACDAVDVRTLLAEPLPDLRALVVRGAVDPGDLFRLVKRRAPNLAHLAVHYVRWERAQIDTILAHPHLTTLAQLELWDVNHATECPFDTLEARRADWSHLRYLGLPGHLVADEIRARFRGDLAPVFIGYDRRQTIALDLEMHGWPDSSR